jgi:hypothetical protein
MLWDVNSELQLPRRPRLRVYARIALRCLLHLYS